MNQTTRCPACQTRFKVVADQLRISQGWVRCGHCQQVFDATLSLQPAEPEAMLPDMPLDQLRGPVARAAAPAPVARAWGSSVTAAHRTASAPAPAVPAPEDETDDGDEGDGFAPTQPGLLDFSEPEQAAPWTTHVPSFLKAPLPRTPAFSPHGVEFPAPGLPTAPAAVPEATGTATAAPSQHAAAPPAMPLGGYELPAPEDDSDSGWPALFDEPAPRPPVAEAGTGPEAPELDLAHFIAELAGAPAASVKPAGAAPLPADDERRTTEAATLSDSDPAAEPELVPEPQPEPEPEQEPEQEPDLPWTLVSDEVIHHGDLAPGAAEPVSVGLADTGPSRSDAAVDASEHRPSTLDELELSFVRDAQRRAFWSGAGVRAGLGAIALLLLLGLGGQVALQERARLAALWPQSRPVLETACSYLQCSVGLHRDIGAVLVEGSSFNRAQGDRYQFSLALRNRSGLPVEAPAIELTLTDADDRPVLRRVLSPADLAAPNPLRAGQEWNTVLPMAIGQGAARIAGYRVLAFYP